MVTRSIGRDQQGIPQNLCSLFLGTPVGHIFLSLCIQVGPWDCSAQLYTTLGLIPKTSGAIATCHQMQILQALEDGKTTR